MEETKIFAVVIISIFVLIFLTNLSYQSYLLDNMLTGFWDADNSFCEECGLDMFCAYFNNGSLSKRSCYILAKQGQDIIINEPAIASISLQWLRINNWSSDLNCPKYFNITFHDLSDDCIDEFPKYQELCLYPLTNKMILSHGDTVSAVLYKNSVNTDLQSLYDEKNNGTS